MVRCPECGAWLWHPPHHFEEHVCPSCGAVLKIKGGLRGFLLEELEAVGSTNPSGGHVHYARDPSYRSDEIIPPGLGGELGEATIPVTEEDAKEEAGGALPPLYADKLRRDAEEAKRRQGEETRVPSKKVSLGDRSMTVERCNHCDTVIMPSDARFCSNCGTSLLDELKKETRARVAKKTKPIKRAEAKPVSVPSENCMVCDLSFSKDDDIVWCPYCGNSAHRNHLLEWIHLGHRCPVCREFLEERDVKG